MLQPLGVSVHTCGFAREKSTLLNIVRVKAAVFPVPDWD